MKLTLGSVTGAPRLISFAGDQLLIAPLDMFGLGTLYEMLAQAFPDQERPKFGDRECRAYIAAPGLPTLLWAVYGRFHDWTHSDCAAKAADASDAERAELLSSAFRKRPRSTGTDDAGTDLADADWGWIAWRLLDAYHIGPETFNKLTLDQLENILMDGKPFEGEDADMLVADVQRIWEESQHDNTDT